MRYGLYVAFFVGLLRFGTSGPYLERPLCGGDGGELTETARQEIHAELQQLNERLDALRDDAVLNADHWADARVFLKGVTWALDFEPKMKEENRQLLLQALRRAKQRTDALAAGRHPWSTKQGRSARGFVSAVDGSIQPYGLVVPASYDPSQPMRLDVLLHGSSGPTGFSELLFLRGFDGGDDNSPPAPAGNFIELYPLGRLGENAYRFEGETDVDEAIAAVCRHYNIDRRRIVLRGGSLGGVGTWQLGLKRPDRYAALGPAAGPVDTIEFAGSPWPHFVSLDPLTPWQKTMLHLVDAIDYTANARMVPVVAAMGAKDPYYGTHLQIQKAFENEQIPFVGLVDENAGHSIGAAVMEQQLRLLGEYASKGADAAPRQIHFVTWTLRYSRCHWIEILGLDTHYQRAEIDARLGEDGSLTISTPKNVRRFAIHPPGITPATKSLSIGASSISLPRDNADDQQPVVVQRRNGNWEFEGFLPDLRLNGKRPGLQGPLDDAFSTPFLCVRGTGQAWHPKVQAWADAQLQRFTYEWRRHYRGDLRIKNDADVTEDDMRKFNLILFGDPGSNRWIGDWAAQLPIRWTRDSIQVGPDQYAAAEHGLQLICPNPLAIARDRYVVLNSGHTYHGPELRFSYMVFPRLGDWAVMKVGDNPTSGIEPSVAENVTTSGFFDEEWAVP